MKKIILLSLFTMCVTGATLASAPDWGRVDTLEHYKIGPGAVYTKIHFPDYPLYIYTTEIDLTNEYTKIEQVQSNDKVPDLVRETTLSQSLRNTTDGHRVYCAVNHDFFNYERGTAIGINLSEGEIPYSRSKNWGRSLIAFDKNNIASVFHPNTNMTVTLRDNTSIKIEDVNLGLDESFEAVLYNKWNTYILSGDGLFIKFEPQGEWTFNGAPTLAKVIEVATTPLQNTKNEYVIYLRGSKASLATEKVSIGDMISINQQFLPGKFGTPGTDIKTAFHGYPSIAFEGKLHEGEYNNFENGREYEVAPRTMLGMSKDGTKAYVVVVDGRSTTSLGVNCIDIANYMLANGSWNVVNFDSGGSSTIVINNELANLPQGATTQRLVIDTFQAVSIAPSSDKVDSYSFVKPNISPLINTKTKLADVYAHNEYGDILDKNVRGLTFKCIPENIGYVDDEGYFHAGASITNGYIEAEKGGVKARLRVSVEGPDEIEFGFHKIVTDNLRSTELTIEGRKGSDVQLISPSAFSWQNSNPDICSFENGIIKGIKEGTSRIIGEFNGVRDTLDVTVIIGVDSAVVEGFVDTESFAVSSTSSAFSKITLSNEGLPTGWNDGLNVNLDLVKDRYPTLTLTKDMLIEGLPDSLTFQLKLSNSFISSIVIHFAGEQSKSTYEIKNMTWTDDLTIPIVINEELDNSFSIPLNDYPIRIQKFVVNLKNVTKTASETISIRDLKAYYPNKSGESSIENDKTDNNNESLSISKIGNKGLVKYNLQQSSHVSVDVYSISGIKLMELINESQSEGVQEKEFSLSILPKGTYIFVLRTKNEITSRKFIF